MVKTKDNCVCLSSTMSRILLLLFFFVIFFALDVYVFQGYKLLVKKWMPNHSLVFHIIYWAIPVILIGLLIGTMIFAENPTKNKVFMWSASILFGIFIAKFVWLLFIILDDVLRILQGQHPVPVSINEITTRMVDKMSNASRLVDKLDDKELVHRKTSCHDKRQVDISITETGQKTLAELNIIVNQIIQEHSHLTPGEYETLNHLLDKLRK